MRKTHLKGFLIAIIGFFIMITLFSLIMPSKVVVSKAQSIHATAARIMPYITDLHEWKKWHPMFMSNSNTIQINKSTNNEPMATWKLGNKENTIRITEISAQSIKFILERRGENPVLNVMSVLPLADAGGNQVTWDALTRLSWYPWEKFSGIFINDISGPGYEQALKNLQQLVQPNP